MTKPLSSIEPVDAQRLPDGQADWAEALLKQYMALVDTLTNDERSLYTLIWRYMARYTTPPVARQFTQINQHPFVVQQLITSLNERKLLWFDEDLRAILQCAPFSVLHTPHRAKVFGWERTYVVSFLDIAPTLIMYGPNVWLEGSTICPRSGEKLSFRVRMREDRTLQFEAPDSALDWRVWLPLPEAAADDVYQQFNVLRPRINAFHSQEDLETHRLYEAQHGPGVIYTLEQAFYLSARLAQSCWYALKS